MIQIANPSAIIYKILRPAFYKYQNSCTYNVEDDILNVDHHGLKVFKLWSGISFYFTAASWIFLLIQDWIFQKFGKFIYTFNFSCNSSNVTNCSSSPGSINTYVSASPYNSLRAPAPPSATNWFTTKTVWWWWWWWWWWSWHGDHHNFTHHCTLTSRPGNHKKAAAPVLRTWANPKIATTWEQVWRILFHIGKYLLPQLMISGRSGGCFFHSTAHVTFSQSAPVPSSNTCCTQFFLPKIVTSIQHCANTTDEIAHQDWEFFRWP